MVTFPRQIMRDGSLLFAEIYGDLSWEALRTHLERIDQLMIMRIVTDEITEQWIDFYYYGQHFTVHQTSGSHYLFAQDAGCPESMIAGISSHLLKLNSLS